MKNFPAPNLKTYNHRPHSNLTFSGSIKHRNENDYQELSDPEVEQSYSLNIGYDF